MTTSTTYCLQGGLEAPTVARRLLLAGRAWDARRQDDIALLLSEVVTNAVLHGGVGPDAELRIDMRVDARVAAFRVYDHSEGFTPPAPGAARPRRGWGLYIVDRLAHRWGVTPVPGGSCVWFEALLEGHGGG